MPSDHNICIKLMGGFAVYCGGQDVTSLLCTKKSARLIEYLILKKGRPVSHDELVNVIWRDSVTPLSALRTMMHRLRAAGKVFEPFDQCIVTNIGAYAWNTQMPCRVDFFEIEACAASAEKAGLKQREADCLRVIEEYKGPLLPENDSEWVSSAREELRECYIKSVVMLSDIYIRRGEIRNAKALLEYSLDMAGYDGRLNAALTSASGKDAETHKLRRNQNLAIAAAKDLFIKESGALVVDQSVLKRMIDMSLSARKKEVYAVSFSADDAHSIDRRLLAEKIEGIEGAEKAVVAYSDSGFSILIECQYKIAQTVADAVKSICTDMGHGNAAFSIKRI